MFSYYKSNMFSLQILIGEFMVNIQNSFFWSKFWGDLGHAESFLQRDKSVIFYSEPRVNHSDF